jgi:hypothetical protein
MTTIGEIGALLSTTLSFVASYKQARAAYVAEHPDAAQTLPGEVALLEVLKLDPPALTIRAEALLTIYGVPDALIPELETRSE